MKEIRRNIDDFKKIKSGLINLQKDFEVVETKHTKRIKTKEQKIFFGNDNKCYYELALINKVKNDGLKYVQKNETTQTANLTNINFYYFNKIAHNSTVYNDVYKLDLTSAYWQLAVNEEIITTETYNYWLENKENFLNGHKKARLKALGSLATEQIIKTYKNGKETKIKKNVNNLTRSLYIYVCEQVDNVMKMITYRYKDWVVYYYWDCFFIKKNAPIKQIIEEIKNFGFKSKFEIDNIDVNINQDVSFVFSEKNKHPYPINSIDLKD